MKSGRSDSIIFISSLAVAAFVTIVIYVFCYVSITEITTFSLTAIFLLTLTTCFVTQRFVFKRFFFESLRKVYQNVFSVAHAPHQKIDKDLKDEEIISGINELLTEWQQDQAKEIDKLKELEAYRREFLGNVSHELKTPIFNVQGYIHTLIDGGIEDQDVNMLYLQKAAKSLDRLISVVDDLESISKLEAGKLIVEPRIFDISELAKDVIESLELQAKEKNISLKIKEPTDKPYYVYADKERIRQVMVNLLVNSIKYGKNAGETEITFRERPDTIIIEIKDDGIGIDKQHLPRLFERFYRVDKSRSREQGGTGLGLAIVKHIIEAHDQKISVSSNIGLGTTFSFTLARSK